MPTQEEICQKCKEWEYEEMLNPYWMDCIREDCPEFKSNNLKMHRETKQQIDILLKLKPERI